MIYKKCIMTIQKNKATLDEDIYLYRLDKNIELHFTIVNNKYKFDKSDLNNIIAQTNAAYFQIRLYKNDDIKYTFAIQATEDAKAILKITDDLIDDPIEVGEYDFQISLLDEEKTSMISMPIVSKQLHVCEPLVSDTAVIGKAVLGLSTAANGEIKNAFDSQGNYIREIHNNGEIISAQMFNKFEEALETNTKAIKNGTGGTGTSYDDTAIKADIQTLKDSQINLVEDETSMEGIKDNEYPTLTTTDKTLIGSINEVNAQYKDIASKVENVGQPTQEQINTAIDKAIEDGKITGAGGINSTAKTLLQTILQNAVYASNQSANITALISALGSNESGGGDTPTVKTYTITNNLTHCSNSNSSTSVNENSNYIATITPTDEYTLTGASVNITMGGTDITSTAYNNGTINISSVTGNIVITISTVQIHQVVKYTITNKLTNCTSSNSDTSIEENKSYAATISPSSGHTLTDASISVTMGEVDITKTAYNNGIINISSVTGNVIITISAVKIASSVNEINPSYLTVKDYKTIMINNPATMLAEMPDTISFVAKDVSNEYWGSGIALGLDVRNDKHVVTKTPIAYTKHTLNINNVLYAVVTVTKADYSTAYTAYKNSIDNEGKIAIDTSSISLGNTPNRFNQNNLPKIVNGAVDSNVIGNLTW